MHLLRRLDFYCLGLISIGFCEPLGDGIDVGALATVMHLLQPVKPRIRISGKPRAEENMLAAAAVLVGMTQPERALLERWFPRSLEQGNSNCGREAASIIAAC